MDIKSLQEKEKEIRAEILKQQDEREKVLLPEHRKKTVGQCFKYKNSYGGDSKPWFLYVKIVDVTSINFFNDEEPVFRVLQIQECSCGRIEIDFKDHSYVRRGEYIPISKTEFEKNSKRILKKAIKYLE